MRFKDLCLLSSVAVLVGALMMRPEAVDANLDTPARWAEGAQPMRGACGGTGCADPAGFKFHDVGSIPRYRLVFPS